MTTAIWIVSGEQYIQEAQASAQSLKLAYPEVTRVLLTPDGIKIGGGSEFDFTLGLSRRQHKEWAHDSIRYFGEACELVTDDPVLYFDSDTYICGNLGGLVGMMRRFDFVGTRAPRRVWVNNPNIPDAFSELNVGVFAFWRSAARGLFADWLKKYEQVGNYGNNDQSSLRAVLWSNCQLSAWIAPIEYNFRFEYGGQVFGQVYVLHGRSKDYPALAAEVNSDLGIRAWRMGELK